MAFIAPTQDQIQRFFAMDIEGPIHMLNLLKFKPDGGLETYMKYGEATAPCLEKVGGKMVYQAQGRAIVIGDLQWDLMFIIEYPNRQAFQDMISSKEYQAGAHLRDEAIEDSRLLCMQQTT